MSTNATWSAPASSGARPARFTSTREATASSWRTWPLCRRRHNGHYADPRIMPSWCALSTFALVRSEEVSDEVGIIRDGVSLLLRGLGADEERRNEESTAIAPAGGRSTRTVGGRTTR